MPQSFEEVRAEFEKMDATVCVPLNAKTKLIGLLVFGDKTVNNYIQEDLDILETLSNHSALAIQNLKLQENLRNATELESFYKFASFVIHDLRNTVSVLAMLADNAKIHLEDPEFRESLKNTLSISVEKMRTMLSRVSMVSGSLSLALTRGDAVKLVEQVLVEVIKTNKFQIVRDFADSLELEVDQQQLRKVLLNLVLNAMESMPDGGTLNVGVQQGSTEDIPAYIQADWKPEEFVAISIADTGCGIPEEFMRTQLFKPFQTTKKKGLGIGLYHCRDIVESHKGRIWVESVVNKGSCFTVGLPVAATGEHQDNGKLAAQ